MRLLAMIMHSKSYSSKFKNLWVQTIRLAGLWVVIINFSSLPAYAANTGEVTDENASIKIKEATTVEDYHALKAYFKSKTAEATRQVRLHEDMLQSYRKRPKADGLAIQMRIHCLNLIRLSQDTQGNYKYLARSCTTNWPVSWLNDSTQAYRMADRLFTYRIIKNRAGNSGGFR